MYLNIQHITLKLLFSISVIILSFSCKKHNPELIRNDFRNKYVGNYQVVKTIESYGSPSCGQYFYTSDTIITVSFGNTDSTLIVLGREVWLDSSESYYAYHYGLIMRKDSIDYNYMNGGLGCGNYEIYKGYKILN